MSVEPVSLSRLPSVSVIIPVRDDPRLQGCLRALRAQRYAGPTEIIVANNGSRPLTGVDDGVHVVEAPEGGSYTARNLAVRRALGEVLAFTDADCVPHIDWIANMVNALKRGAGVAAGQVEVFARDASRPHPIEAYELVHAFPQEKYVKRLGASVTANMATARLVFDEVGEFRGELLSGADIEWSERANAAGFTTVFAGDAVVRHPARDSYRAMGNKLDRVIEGRHHRRVLEGGSPRAPWPRASAFRPPLGALGRARHPALISPRARAAFLIGEFYHRYRAAYSAARLAMTSRRTS